MAINISKVQASGERKAEILAFLIYWLAGNDIMGVWLQMELLLQFIGITVSTESKQSEKCDTFQPNLIGI